ncbi:MAG: tetratricopeptide repeat protein [Gemmatimonadetes bacterium]|nr:tetratricopeptide repeat protein [Gemmatimonadota bacterium]MBI2404313.1 tetratricopeptide repeat protein [Gemmatimonadota bacterium]MBI2537261.1 tetratricopeptide repeat protein [Gemmatimonadota bacterium]
MNAVVRLWHGARTRAAGWAARYAARLALRDRQAAERWLRRAAGLAPGFSFVHRDLVAARRRADDRLGALEIARRITRRFDRSADAWVLLGEAYNGAFRPDDAIVAFERALAIEERSDAAMAAGELYARKSDYATAGARYARAYAAGGGPDALRANAKVLRIAGDIAAAQQAQEMWERETGTRWTDE